MIATQMSRRPLALCARRAASRAGVYLAIAAGVTVFPQTAQAAVPLNLCVPAPDATGILRAVVGANPTVDQLPPLLLKDVHVRVTPSGYAVSSGGPDATVPARHPPPGDPRRRPRATRRAETARRATARSSSEQRTSGSG